MNLLGSDHPNIYTKFIEDHFVVRRANTQFNAVGADMALEQTINRSQKSSGGIIGETR